MNDLLFSVPRGEAPQAADLATQAGLDPNLFQQCIEAPAALAHVQADVQEGLRRKITGTPTFVIDGETYVGQIPDEVLERHLGSLE
jgi:predicted DsbA family dithiol-disulfide isomerase